jgi:pyruvate ferredoxin oxidoreductase alpha subunit
MAVRDCGWIQMFVENGQEATDMSIIAFRNAEDKNVMLPFILNLDGFTLSHFIEPITFPPQAKVKKYLPEYKTSHKMDLAKPMSIGLLGAPDVYTEARKATDDALLASKPHIVKALAEFEKEFGRKYDLVEKYRTEDAETIIVVMGSIAETAMTAVDEMREAGQKVGLVRIRLWRPFPVEDFLAAVKGCKNLAVADRHIIMGFPEGPVATEIRTLMYNEDKRPNISNFVVGLGGRDVPRDHFKYIAEKAKASGLQGRYEMVGVLE